MAELIQDVILRVKADSDELRKGMNDVDGEIKDTNKSASSLQSSFKGMLPALGVAAIVGGLIKIGKASLAAADAQAKSNQKLLIAANGRVAVQNKLLKQASELQKLTLFGDEATIEAQAKLLPLLNGNADAVESLIPLIQDFAQFSGMDLVSAADLVGKSVGTSTNALTRYGVQIEGAVGSSERLESALSSLNKMAGGQAAAAAKVGLGGWEQFKGIMGDVSEEIGFLLLDGLQPLFDILKSGASILVSFVAQLRGAEERTGMLGKAIDLLRKPFLIVIDYAKDLYQIYVNIADVVFDLAKKMGVLGAASVALNFALDQLLNVLNFVGTAFNVIFGTINGIVTAIDESVESISNLYNAIKNFDLTAFKNFGLNAAEAFKEGFDEITKPDHTDRQANHRGREIGSAMGQGIAEGISDEQQKIYDALAKLQAEEFKDGFSMRDGDGRTEDEFQIMLGLDTEESIKNILDWIAENREKIEGEEDFNLDLSVGVDIQKLAENFEMAADLLTGFFDALDFSSKVDKEIEALDELINKQRSVVDESAKIAEQGNAKQLALEEQRLQQLELQKEASAQKQVGIQKAQFVAEKALAIAQIQINLAKEISAIRASAALLGPAGLAVAQAQIVSARVEAILNTVLVAAQTFTGLAGFADGGYTGKGSKYEPAGIVHKDEFVLTKEDTNRTGIKNMSSKEVADMITKSKSLSVGKDGLLIDTSAINEKVKLNTSLNEMVNLNKQMLKAMKMNGININIDENGFAMRTHKVIKRQNIINSL